MSDIVKKSFGAVTATALDEDAAAQLLAGIEETQATTNVPGDGTDLIKMDKSDGSWGQGQSNDPVEDGAAYYVNLLSLCTGWVCWSDYEGKRKNERLGEVMFPQSLRQADRPSKPGPIDGFAFKDQKSFEAVCLDGKHAGRKVRFANGSVGTLKAFKKLEDAIKAQLRTNRAYPCPVIQFDSDSYRHGDYGKIWNPIFHIVDWADLQGNLLSEAGDAAPQKVVPIKPKPAPEAAAPKVTGPKARPKAAAEPQEEPVEAEAVAQPRGPRRRPPAG